MRRFWDGLERRRARRYEAQLPARLNGIMVYSSGTEDSAGGNLLRVSCLTRDISRTGLSLVVPVEKLDARFLPRESCLMLVMLELPEGGVALEAAPMHYKIVEEDEGRLYHLGAGITKISEADRTRYLEYLDSLG
ncbi:MAG TPA: hypothetical protein VGB73_02520 [Pyrinomonadaceae bacterium]|jgi:hypothetical protein